MRIRCQKQSTTGNTAYTLASCFAHPTWNPPTRRNPCPSNTSTDHRLFVTSHCFQKNGHPFKSSKGAESSTQSASGMIPTARKMPTRRLTWVADRCIESVGPSNNVYVYLTCCVYTIVSCCNMLTTQND